MCKHSRFVLCLRGLKLIIYYKSKLKLFRVSAYPGINIRSLREFSKIIQTLGVPSAGFYVTFANSPSPLLSNSRITYYSEDALTSGLQADDCITKHVISSADVIIFIYIIFANAQLEKRLMF